MQLRGDVQAHLIAVLAQHVVIASIAMKVVVRVVFVEEGVIAQTPIGFFI
jgi:hypothetical protein